jgi:hypothetical protein
MRRKALFFAVFLVMCAAASAQESSDGRTAVTLQNQENSTFHYVMDPADLAGITASSPLLESEVALFFSKETAVFPFASIKPKSAITIEGLAEGMHLLVGFFAIEEKTEFPVRIVSIQVDKKLGLRTYELYTEPALLNPARGLGKLAIFGATPSLSAAKTEAAPPAAAPTVKEPEKPAAEKASMVISEIATFSLSYTPAVFTREKDKTFIVLPIEEAGYWNRNGTRIASISGGISGTDLALELKSASGFSKNVSYFLYLFQNRNLGQENAYTIEIIPVLEGRSAGIALLWEKGRSAPRFFGALEIEGPVLRVKSDISALAKDFVSVMSSGASADVTSCYFDETATYEEFFYTTFAVSELASSKR